MSLACCIISSSTPKRPAVSTITTEYCDFLAKAIASLETFTGLPTPLPASGAKTGTPTFSPSTCSWVTAFGRCRSAATNKGVWFCSLSHLANFPARVVLPEPCRPANMITVGGFLENESLRASPPKMAFSSSLTIWTTCCAGFRAFDTSSPNARSRILPVNSLTTSRETSASSSALRISLSVPSISAAERRPLPRRFLKVSESLSERFPNN